MITVPVSASMYQTMVANIQQIHPNGDGTVCLANMQVHPHTTQLNNHNHNTSQTNNFTTNNSNINNGRIRAIMTPAPKAINNLSNSTNNSTKTECETNNNNNSNIVIINDKFHKHTVEHADSQHTHATIDEGGNIVIHFGTPSTTVQSASGSSGSSSSGNNSTTVIKTEAMETNIIVPSDRSVTLPS